MADDVKQALPVPAWLRELFDAAKDSTGLRRTVRLQLTNQDMSPAVCGLFRPVILLPQSLAQQLPPPQARAVLLHELTHLRRGDVWMNCAQALGQIVYWWHPLLWLANARIRRVREEAVDDAVMLALPDAAETYAPTLLEVAKLAFHRPLASLGLVGILESRSALRQRIERLVDFHPPRRAGLTLASLLGIVAFTALAVPMGEAPEGANVPSGSNESKTLTVKVDPDVFISNVQAQAAANLHATNDDYTDILLDILRGEGVDCAPPHGIAFNTQTGEITTQNTPEALDIFRQVIEQLNRPDGKSALPLGFSPFHRKDVLITAQFYQLATADFKNLVQGLDAYNDQHGGASWWSVAPDHFKEFNENIKSRGLRPFNSPRIQTGHGITASLYIGNRTNSVTLDCRPFIGDGAVDLTVRASTTGRFSDNPAGDWPTTEGMTNCAFNASVSAEDQGGIVLRAENPEGPAANNLVVILGVQIVTNYPPPAKTGERLEGIIARTQKPSGTVMGITGVVPVASEQASLPAPDVSTDAAATSPHVSPNLYTRAFMITSSPGLVNLRKKAGLTRSSTPDEYLRGFSKLLSASGTTLPPTSIWSKQNGPLLVRGTPQQLDAVEQMVLELNGLPPRKTGEAASAGTIMDNASPTAAEAGNPTSLSTRTFKIDPDTLFQGLKSVTPPSFGSTDINLAAKQLFTALGLNLNPPKSVFFNDKLGTLFVRATEQDLDVVEKTVQVLNSVPSQIHIKVRFIETPKEMTASLGADLIPTSITNLVGILSGPNLQRILPTLEQRKGFEELAEPEVTTTSGRQTQMRATVILTIITNIVFQETSTNAAITPVQQQVEVGPTLDVIPVVMSDGYTLDLKLIASLTEFLGYDKPATNSTPVVTSKGEIVNVPNILPKFGVRQAEIHVKLWDGQTVVLGGMVNSQIQQVKTKVPLSGDLSLAGQMFRSASRTEIGKNLLVFVTVNIVDPAGNRVHNDDEMPFAGNSIPPQDYP